MRELMNVAETQCCAAEAPSVQELLLSQKKALEKRLEDVNAAIAALEKNPEVADVLTLLSKVGCR